MNVVTMDGETPDGEPMRVTLDVDLPDDQLCTAGSGEARLRKRRRHEQP